MNKSHLIADLKEAQDDLNSLIRKLEKLEDSEPEGKIGIKHGKYPYFNLRTEKSGKTGQYLKKNEKQLITALSQKRFNHGLKDAAGTELARIEKCLAIMGNDSFSVQGVLASMPEEIRPFIDPDLINQTDSQAKWNTDKNHRTNPIVAENTFTTSNGEKVRSKSEFIIAELLKNAGVPYCYEKPLDQYTGRYDIFPDFTCLNKRTGKTYYWEHFGRIDDPKYCIDFVMRIQNYAAVDIFPGSELLISLETQRYQIRTTYIKALIDRFLL